MCISGSLALDLFCTPRLRLFAWDRFLSRQVAGQSVASESAVRPPMVCCRELRYLFFGFRVQAVCRVVPLMPIALTRVPSARLCNSLGSFHPMACLLLFFFIVFVSCFRFLRCSWLGPWTFCLRSLGFSALICGMVSSFLYLGMVFLLCLLLRLLTFFSLFHGRNLACQF